MKKQYIAISVFFFFVFMVGLSFFLTDLFYHKAGSGSDIVRIEIVEGDDGWIIARKLKKNNLISSVYVFLFGVWNDGLRGTFRAGVYELVQSLSPADIALIISSGESKLRDVRVTFPEGWGIKEMSDRLRNAGLSGEEFLAVARHPTETMRRQFDFLADLPEEETLEGYLFPDTYFFLPETTGEEIARRMLDTFDERTYALRRECQEQKKNFSDMVIMASILEGEVRTKEDRQIVSGIFWKRIESGIPLQSDATLDYVLQSGKIQHNGRDLETDSPYNTYLYKGLPPGPIGNPSLDAIETSIHPKESSYWYFLSDPKTGKTYFSKDFEEHKKNKEKVGL